MRKIGVAAAMLLAAACVARAEDATKPSVWSQPQPVKIEGYRGDAMEPFLSRDGATLFFKRRTIPRSIPTFTSRRDATT